jgi:hypothetical protein
MSGALDPNRISTFELTDAEAFERLKAISRTLLPSKWRFGLAAYSQTKMPPVSVASSFIHMPFSSSRY